MRKVLFVCTGNTCRSPMAEGIFRKIAAEKDVRFEILSAGIFAREGMKASDEAVIAAAEKGINISDHVSQSVTHEILNDANLILTMTEGHKKLLLERAPEYKDKIFTLKEFNGKQNEIDIEDPFGQGLGAYRECIQELGSEINQLMITIEDALE